MRSTCVELSVPASVSGLWLSVRVPVLVSALQSAEARKVGSGAVGAVGVAWGPGVAAEEEEEGQVKGETGEKREEQRSLTGQKADPLGMKFTLFLSGQEKRGKPFDLRDLGGEVEKRLCSLSVC